MFEALQKPKSTRRTCPVADSTCTRDRQRQVPPAAVGAHTYDILRLEISVDHGVVVNLFQRAQQLSHVEFRFVHREFLAPMHQAEQLASASKIQNKVPVEVSTHQQSVRVDANAVYEH